MMTGMIMVRVSSVVRNDVLSIRRGVTIHTCIGLHTNLYSAKNRENESEALAQDD